MEKKVTTMELKVNLQCCRCHKKVKKVLCKFPQIRDQKYDEKANTVTITVVSCCPEKIKDKICRKGGQYIECITIKPDPKPTPKLDPKPTPTPKPDPKPKPEPDSKQEPEPQQDPIIKLPPDRPRSPTAGCPMIYYPRHVWGSCYTVGTPLPPHPCYSMPVYDSCGYGGGDGYGNKHYYVSRGDCLCEENPQACTIM